MSLTPRRPWLPGSFPGRSPLARSALVLAGGTIAGQAAGLLVAPILTRMYTDVEFGTYGLFTTFLTFAGAVTTAQFESAIVSARSDDDAVNLARLTLGLQVPLAVVASASFLLLRDADVVGFGAFPTWAAGLAFLALVGLGTFQVARYWLLRQSRYGAISYLNPLQSVTRAAAHVGLGLLGAGFLGLAVGEAVARMVGGVSGLLRAIDRRGFRAVRGSFRDLREVAVRYANFPKYMIGSTLLDRGGYLLPLPFIAGTFGLGAAGLYALVQRVFGVPTTLIGQSLADVFHRRVATHQRDGDAQAASHLVTRLTLTLGAVGSVIAIGTIVTGPKVFAIVFGEQWRTAGTIAGAMSIAFAASLVIVPLSRIMVVFEGQREKLKYDVLSLGFTLASCLMAVRGRLTLATFIWVLSILNFLAYGYYYALLHRVMTRWFAAH